MSRTTGFTATATVNMVALNLFNECGVFPPELVGKKLNCTGIFNRLSFSKKH